MNMGSGRVVAWSMRYVAACHFVSAARISWLFASASLMRVCRSSVSSASAGRAEKSKRNMKQQTIGANLFNALYSAFRIPHSELLLLRVHGEFHRRGLSVACDLYRDVPG